MQNKFNNLLTSTRWSIGYIIFIPVIVCIFVFWNGLQRINEFEKSHYQVAESTVKIVAREISKRIKNQERLLRVFSTHEAELLYRISLSPDDDALKAELDFKVAESFPNFFAVSLADQEGNPIIDDFDGFINTLCLEDLKSHADGHPLPIRVHPNTQAYHVDTVVPWQYVPPVSNKKHSGLLFVSFKPEFLFRLLALSAAPEHELMLINKDFKNLIEITEKGTRDKLKRNDYRLTNEEQQRKLYSIDIENSVWHLIDFRKKTLFTNYKKDIIKFSLIVNILFFVASVIMVVILLRVEKRRQHAEKMKEEMISLFNHDLRAPLSSIYGFLEMYLESDLCEQKPDKCKTLAKYALDNSLVMQEIINDILDIQKMESGEMSFDFCEVDIISLVKDTVEMSMQNGLRYSVKLKMSTDINEIICKVDDLRIKQAITNLLSNAIKYSPKDETVLVSVHRESDHIIIAVSDSGPGIGKEFQPFIFDKFAQSKSKLTRRVEGTGLGLAIVKYIITSHSGEISFVSEENKGTTFKISLPL